MLYIFLCVNPRLNRKRVHSLHENTKTPSQARIPPNMETMHYIYLVQSTCEHFNGTPSATSLEMGKKGFRIVQDEREVPSASDAFILRRHIILARYLVKIDYCI